MKNLCLFSMMMLFSTSVKAWSEPIPSLSQPLYRTDDRIEWLTSVGTTLGDPFYHHVIATVGAAYRFREDLALQISGDLYGAFSAKLPVVGASPASEHRFNHMVNMERVELLYTPIYGKLSLFAESVLHFDTFVSVGPELVALSQSSQTVAATVAIGQHYFINSWCALRVELREHILSWARDPAVDPAKAWNAYLTASLGMSFFFPIEK